MPAYCDQADCRGHLGKFDDCLSEAIWEASLDGFCDSTGDTECDGHYCLVSFPENDTVTIQDGPTVLVPAGWYIVETVNSGAVYVTRYNTEGEAREEYDAADKRYGEWLDQDEEDTHPTPCDTVPGVI
jgi:hypothetical protein